MLFVGAIGLGLVLGVAVGRWWALAGSVLVGIVTLGALGAKALLGSLIYSGLTAIGVVVGVLVRRRREQSTSSSQGRTAG